MVLSKAYFILTNREVDLDRDLIITKPAQLVYLPREERWKLQQLGTIKFGKNNRFLIRKQAALKTLKEWLDTGKYTAYFLNDSGEIQTKRISFDEEIIKDIENNDLSSIPF